ncbi:Uncharacterised protein [uncultured archaeon]|nr:Uncharacterised protein [uncultured archaeon]
MNRLTVLLIILVIGIGMSLFAWETTTMAGHKWLDEKSTVDWHMTNYFVVPGSVAFLGFGVLSFYLGGIFTGIAIPMILVRLRDRKVILLSVLCLVLALVFTGLGFNTLDWTLGSVYYPNNAVPPDVNVNLLSIHFSLDVWNMYFFVVLLPLWLGAFLVAAPLTIIALVREYLKHY